MSRWAAGTLAAALSLIVAGCGGGGTPTVPRPAPVPPAPRPAVLEPGPGETLAARVLRPTALRASPGGHVLRRIGRRTKFGSRQVLAVRRVVGRWAAVLHPSLGNGRTGWIDLSDARILRETWSIVVHLDQRRAVLRHRGRPVRTFRVAVGAPGTATPKGTFGVTDRLRTGGPGSPYGCCVLALSARQPDIPQDWPGGDRVAIHGTDTPSSIGSAVSHGCIRAAASTMRLLMSRVPLGATVQIRS